MVDNYQKLRGKWEMDLKESNTSVHNIGIVILKVYEQVQKYHKIDSPDDEFKMDVYETFTLLYDDISESKSDKYKSLLRCLKDFIDGVILTTLTT